MRLVFVLGLLLVGCVDDSLEVGDDRARLACEDAVSLAVPPVGCTTVIVESTSPYGCFDVDNRVDRAGTWVRITTSSNLAASLQIVPRSSACTLDGGMSCAASATIRPFDGTPCACVSGSTFVQPLTSSFTLSFGAPVDVLLEPLGGTFELVLCAPHP